MDPFDPQNLTAPSDSPGFLGLSPQAWRDMAVFGGNLSAAANARTSSGHLQYGAGLAGPLGAATNESFSQGQKLAGAMADLGIKRETQRKLNYENQLTAMGMPFQQALAGARMNALGGTGAPSGGYQDALGTAESGNQPGAVNPLGYSGLYQMGAGRLADLGMYQPAQGENLKANQWKGAFNIPGFPDVKTQQDFLKSPAAQRVAFNAHVQNIDNAIAATPGADQMNRNGLQAVAHLGGVGGMQKFVQTNGQYNPADANGTHLSDYYARFSRLNSSPLSGPRAEYAPQQTPQIQDRAVTPAPRMVPVQQQQGAPDQSVQQQADMLRSEALQMNNQANRVALLGPQFGDPALIRQQAMEKLKLADQLLTAGPMATEKARAEAPFRMERLSPGSVAVNPLGQRIGFAPIQSDEVITEGPNKGMHVTVMRDPTTGAVINGPSNGQGAGMEGVPTGAIPKGLPPSEEGRLKAAGGVEGEDLNHDRKIVETDLAHVIDNTIQGKLQMLKLRTLIDPAATGFAGETRMALKNAIQTLSPSLADAFDMNASPAQELKKIATLGASKSEQEDHGAAKALGLMKIYMDANPNLENQPDANQHMANMILMAYQLREDYATGATAHYQQSREGFVGPEHKTYVPISKYDQTFIQKMRPEVYKAATDALNGLPYDAWSKGLTAPQMQIVGGILQRADPNAQINVKGQSIPVSSFKNVIGPTDIMGASNGR